MLGKQIDVELKENNIPHWGTDIDLDITNKKKLEHFVKDKKIEWIINCSAYTAVDKAEEEKELAYKINTIGVKNIAKIAKQKNAKLIHFSTDYVFDGKSPKPYKETDTPNPQSVYGRTKLQGEIFLKQNTENFFLFRICWLYGVYGANFVKTMVRLFKVKDKINVVDDQIGCPTYTGELAKNIIFLIKKNLKKYGVYHYSDEGEISWFDFAKKIMDFAHKFGFITQFKSINPIPSEMYPTPAKRPKFSLFSKDKIKKELLFSIVDWEINLKKYFSEWKKLNDPFNTNKKKILN